MAEPRPSFTAVNGASPPAHAPSVPPASASAAAPAPSPISESHRDVAKETAHQTPNYSNHDRPPESAGSQSHNGREANMHRESRASPAPPLAAAPIPTSALASIQQSTPTQKPEHHHHQIPHSPLTEVSRSQSQMHHAEHTNIHANTQPPPAGMMSPHKRKRSLSQERENSLNSTQPPNAPPQSPRAPRMPNGGENGPHREPYSPQHTYPHPQDVYQQPPATSYPPPPQHSYPPPPDQRNGHPDIYPRPSGPVRHEYDPPLDPSIAHPQERPYYSESRLAEVLERENRGYDTMPTRENYVTPEEDDDPHGQYGSFMTSRDSQSADMERKRRKRVFSNRTKTGCMTCRRRKKKCDEQHPECNNCLRGGFVCEGYTMRNTWQKPANAKAPIPLQSKNGYGPPEGTPGRAPYPPMSRYQDGPEYSSPAQPPSHSSRPSYDGKRDSISEHESVYGRNSPPAQKGQPAWSKAPGGRPYPSNPPAASKYQGDEHRGSVHDLGPDGQDYNAMQPPPPVNRTGSAQSQYSQPGHSQNHGNTPPSHNAQAAAQAALTHPASIRPSQSRRNNEQYTEREKMLKGMYYYPMTPALTEDRERCIAAIWRFNNATNPSHGASPEERIRLFRQILALRPSPEPPLSNGEAPPTNFPLPFGSCGERVVVEAPFHCDYGYNITIGDDVLIGADCRISDTCSVTIGARCILSPNVKLVCATYPIDPRRRMGSNGPALGRNIVIEEDCWIGAGVTILAGVRVGKSSTVGAGSLLHQDVPRFTVVAGNPAKVSRGIYDGSGDGQ